MFVVEVSLTLRLDRPLDREGVSDLIEVTIDSLDDAGIESDMSTTGVGTNIAVAFLTFTDGTDVHAIAPAIIKALAKAGVGTHTIFDLHTTMRVLEPA